MLQGLIAIEDTVHATGDVEAKAAVTPAASDLDTGIETACAGSDVKPGPEREPKTELEADPNPEEEVIVAVEERERAFSALGFKPAAGLVPGDRWEVEVEV